MRPNFSIEPRLSLGFSEYKKKPESFESGLKHPVQTNTILLKCESK